MDLLCYLTLGRVSCKLGSSGGPGSRPFQWTPRLLHESTPLVSHLPYLRLSGTLCPQSLSHCIKPGTRRIMEKGYSCALGLSGVKDDVNVNDIHLAIQIFTTRIARTASGVLRTACATFCTSYSGYCVHLGRIHSGTHNSLHMEIHAMIFRRRGDLGNRCPNHIGNQCSGRTYGCEQGVRPTTRRCAIFASPQWRVLAI